MKKVFICSPFRGDVKGNTEKARRYCRKAYEAGCLPVAPHLLFPQFLDEMNEAERASGIAMGLELLLICFRWRCLRISLIRWRNMQIRRFLMMWRSGWMDLTPFPFIRCCRS